MNAMIDEVIFDLLHIEMVNSFAKQDDNNKTEEINVTALENIGHRTGYRLIERLTRDSQMLKEELDAVKYICKEFWTAIFHKPVDNLRTNHQGIYAIVDNKFRFIANISAGEQYMELMPKYLAFSCGLIRGALCNLGLRSVVTAEVITPPSCRFQVQIQYNPDRR